MDTGAWILTAVIVVLLALWIISVVRRPRRVPRAPHPEDDPWEQVRGDDRGPFGRGEMGAGDNF